LEGIEDDLLRGCGRLKPELAASEVMVSLSHAGPKLRWAAAAVSLIVEFVGKNFGSHFSFKNLMSANSLVRNLSFIE
jgi:hypothetical protein